MTAPAIADSSPTFHFELCAERRLLIVSKSGYWDMTTFDRFARAFRDALRRMRADQGCDYCLVDASNFAVQPVAIASALQTLVESFHPSCPRRMAGVTGSQLSRLQARHAGDHPRRRVFSTRAEAEAWLFAPDG